MTTPLDSTEIGALEPKAVWRFFAELSAVPRPSKHEEQVRAHMRTTAQRLGFNLREDSVGNLLIQVPASPGCENAPITVLQGHLDMVADKNAATVHDFERDPIRLVLDQDEKGGRFVRADGTTLGADNGIGLALALAAASLPEVVHGPLEILCTVDEEMGMTGAKALPTDFIKGRRMLNLDSEDDDTICIGCAGGMDATLRWELPAGPLPKRAGVCRIAVSGLRGGHSGSDIHLNRANAIKLLVQTLHILSPARLRLAELRAGSKRNVIPREASAVVVGPVNLARRLTQAAEQVQAEAVQYGAETGCTITVETASAEAATSPADARRVLATLAGLPHGVLAVVPDMPGLVQTSNSTSTVESRLEAGKLQLTVGCLSRSSSRPQLHATVRQVTAVGELGGAAVESGNEYPGWAPNMDSPVLATCRRVYERLFGQPPKVTAIHAGLECGIIGERVGQGQMDMVSIGPQITGAHSPDERVYVASVQKSWTYLTAILAELARG